MSLKQSSPAFEHDSDKATLQCVTIDNLYINHHQWLKSWLTRRLSSRDDAEDLAQDTFFQVIKADTVDEIRSPRSYLRTIASRLVINVFRRRKIEESYLESLESLPQATVVSAQDHYVTIETLIEIDTTLSRLRAPVRNAFLMSRLEGLTHKSIAEKLSVSDRTVKNYVSQAMLRCLIAAEYDN